VAIGLASPPACRNCSATSPAADVARVDAVLTAHALPTRLTSALPVAELMAAMTRDKKMRSGMPRFVILTRFGESVTRDGILPTLVEAIWRQVGAL